MSDNNQKYETEKGSKGNLSENNKAFELADISAKLIDDAREALPANRTIRLPIASLSSFGAGVSSLIPALRTVTQTTTVNTSGLFRVANATAGDTLKLARDGTYWGAMKTAAGTSKMGKFAAAGPLSASSSTVMAFNPATIMMAAALMSIEKELSSIEKTEKQILAFLQNDKDSEIEGDVETISELMKKYKLNWDNEKFVTGSFDQTLAIQARARKNMIFYQKTVNGALEDKIPLTTQTIVSQKMNDLLKDFKYYRLCLYSFSLSSLFEVMISGNYSEDNIKEVKTEIIGYTKQYKDLYDKSSKYITELSKKSIETNLLKSVGNASKSVGKFIGSIPVIKEGLVDEFLDNEGSKIKNKSKGIENKAVDTFEDVKDPNTKMITRSMDDLSLVCNHTTQILVDKDNVYLVTDKDIKKGKNKKSKKKA